MEIINIIRKELKSKAEKKYQQGAQNFFKEPVMLYGVRTPITRTIARKYFREIKHLSKDEILKLSEQLLKSGMLEESFIAFSWAFSKRKEFEKKDFKTFESWVKKYVTNWALCDDFCNHAFGYFLSQYPEHIPQVKKWTKSKNRWLRRASAVIFIGSGMKYYPKKNYLEIVFYISKQLLEDQDDLVQKGYGWLLKVASKLDQKAVFDFVMKHKKKMPRTALRYAIEHMPKSLKRQAMS